MIHPAIAQPQTQSVSSISDRDVDREARRRCKPGTYQRVSKIRKGYLEQGGKIGIPYNLTRGRNYCFVVVGDEQALDVDDHAHAHTPLVPSQQPETFTQTVARLLLPKADTPHTHCATCDEQVQTAARQKREDDRYYCTMVTVTFLTLFVCGMLLGVVIVAANAKRARGSGS